MVTIGFSLKTLRPDFKPDADMIEMHMVRRTDHQKIELFVGDQLFGGGIGGAGGNAFFGKTRQASRVRIDITGDLEAFVHGLEDITQIAKTEASEPDGCPTFILLVFPVYCRNLFSQTEADFHHRQPKSVKNFIL